MSFRENINKGIESFGEWFGLVFAKDQSPYLRVIEDHKNYLTAVYEARDCTDRVFSTLQVNAGQNPCVILEGPTQTLIHTDGRVAHEQRDRVVILEDGKQINSVLYFLESKKPERELVSSTTTGNIWRRAGYAVTDFIENGIPNDRAAERGLTKITTAIDYTLRFEQAVLRMHLHL